MASPESTKDQLSFKPNIPPDHQRLVILDEFFLGLIEAPYKWLIRVRLKRKLSNELPDFLKEQKKFFILVILS